mgnify:FL=1
MMKGSKLTTNCNLAHFLIDFVDNCCYIEPLLTKPNWNCSMSDNNFTIRPIELFKVLSDPTRLKIFQILFNKESRCVGELVEILDQPQPTISRHLNHLKKLGILSCVRDGTWMWYEVADDLPEWCQEILDITYKQISSKDIDMSKPAEI